MADLTKYLLHHNKQLYECILVSFLNKGPKDISISELKEYPYAIVWNEDSFIQSIYERIWTSAWDLYQELPAHKIEFPLTSLRNTTILFIKEI